MSEFDPYYEWLGIPLSDQPVSHYRLLGIPDFDGNADIIKAASERQTIYLRTLQSGEHAVLVAQMLNEVSQARATLLDMEQKAVYDDELRKQQTTQSKRIPAPNPVLRPPVPIPVPIPALRTPVPVPVPITVLRTPVPTAAPTPAILIPAPRQSIPTASQVSSPHVTAHISRTSRRYSRRRGGNKPFKYAIVFCLGIGTVVLLLLGVRSSWNEILDVFPPNFGGPQYPGTDPGNKPEANPPTDSGGGAPPVKPMRTEPKPAPKPIRTVPKPAPKPIEPAELEKLTAALKLGRAALSDRNLDITAEQLAIAAPLARSGEPQKAFIRLKTMHDFMVQFMRLSNEAMDQYENGSEIVISKSNTVVVVEATPQELTIKVAGAEKTYLRNELSTGLAIGIADTNFKESEYKSTLKAAFVITQKTLRDFEVERARGFWKQGPESIEIFEGFISDDYEFTSE
jgi:hypothetical protein